MSLSFLIHEFLGGAGGGAFLSACVGWFPGPREVKQFALALGRAGIAAPGLGHVSGDLAHQEEW